MLNELHIENIAVIERADITFTAGLNVLTGETGAGKSIVIDSIGAVLGERVSRELVRHGAEKGVVTAVFSMDGCEQWLADNEIDADDELILQRRITADGKSGCRICGVPVTAAQMKELRASSIYTVRTTAGSLWTSGGTLNISTCSGISARSLRRIRRNMAGMPR